jgi:hypothetical protein
VDFKKKKIGYIRQCVLDCVFILKTVFILHKCKNRVKYFIF